MVCLKYLVLANMLMQSDVDPFGSQEAKPFQSNEEVKAMTDLVQAYQANDITSFESLLEKHKKSISEDVCKPNTFKRCWTTFERKFC